MTSLTIKQVKDGIPIWDIYNAFGEDAGVVTNFPGEGIMATVRDGENKTTIYNALTLHEVVERATAAYVELFEPMQDDEYIEDEDGSIAHMRMCEREAERAAERDWGSVPYWDR
jgi:hypothetical protein